MKRIHPNLNRGVACFLAATLFVMGCRSTSSGVNNPFMAPDRVSPPSTRVLAPGQAQPYYQGDPLPTMQSGTSVPTSPPAAADTAAARSASGRTLAWNAPASGAPSPTPANTTPPWGVTPQAAVPLARANEGAVSVPTDTNTLRFALPSQTVAQDSSTTAAGSGGGPQPSQIASPANNQGVALASFNAPANNGLAPVGAHPTLNPTPQAAPSWQSPQLGSSISSPPGYAPGPLPNSPATGQPYMASGMPGYATAQVPQAMPNNQMAVQLRAVPSPPPQPGDPIPRVRIPGYDVPETAANDNFRARTSMR